MFIPLIMATMTPFSSITDLSIIYWLWYYSLKMEAWNTGVVHFCRYKFQKNITMSSKSKQKIISHLIKTKPILYNCILCVIMVIPFVVQGQTYTTATYNLKGKVKSVTSQAYQTQEKNRKIVEDMKRSVQHGTFSNASFSPQGLM